MGGEYALSRHVTWDRLAEICGQFLSKGQLVDVDRRLLTRQWDDDAGKRYWAKRGARTARRPTRSGPRREKRR